MNCAIKRGGGGGVCVKELKFIAAASCVSGDVGVNYFT